MTINQNQINKLIEIVSGVTEDSMDCDGCFKYLAEFAEINLSGKSVPEAMKCIEVHLENCFCCKHEFGHLLDALRDIE